MMRKENTMNSNREIRVMIFEPGKEPYTAVLEDSLEHRQALVGGEIECIYGDTPEGDGVSLTENQIAYFRHYFTGPQPSAVTFEVQSAKDMEEFLRLMFGGRKGGGSK